MRVHPFPSVQTQTAYVSGPQARRAWPQWFQKQRGPSGRLLLRTDVALAFPHFALLPMAEIARPRTGCTVDLAVLPPFRATVTRGRTQKPHNPTSFLTHTKNRPAFDCCPTHKMLQQSRDNATTCVTVHLPKVNPTANAPKRRRP